MKKLSKIVSVVLSLALCLGMASPAFAASFSQLQEAIDDTGNSKGTAILDDNDQETGRYGYAHNAETNKYDIEAWTSDDGTRNIQLNENVNRTPEDGSFDKSSGINIGTVHKQTQCGGLGGVKDTDFSVTEHTNVVSIDLNGHDINGACDKSTNEGTYQWGTVPFDSVIHVGEEGDLTVTDSTAHFEDVTSEETGETSHAYISGKITGGNGKNYGDLNDNFWIGWSYGGGVYIEGDGKFTLEDGTISENHTPTCGGGVYVAKNGNFEMNGGQISDNKGDFGGGVCNNGSFKMTGGTIKDNTAKYSGGGVASHEEATFIIDGTVDICGNTTTDPNYNRDKFPASRFPGFSGHGDGDHIWGDWKTVKDATCAEKGRMIRTCSNNGCVEEEEIPLLAHTSGEAARENEVPAQPGVEGSYDLVVRCTACGNVISSEHVTTSALPVPSIPDDGADTVPDAATIEDQEVPLAGLMPLAQLLEELRQYEEIPEIELPEDFKWIDHEYAQAIYWGLQENLVADTEEEPLDPDEVLTVGLLREVLVNFVEYKGAGLAVTLEGEDDEIVFDLGERLAAFYAELEASLKAQETKAA